MITKGVFARSASKITEADMNHMLRQLHTIKAPLHHLLVRLGQAAMPWLALSCVAFSQEHELGVVSMMLHFLIVKTVILISLIGMPKTGCSGETRLVLHASSSS